MSTLTRGRRLAVEVSWDDDKDAILWVGAVPLHQHWLKLAAHFGDLLLPPQRRIDGGRAGWTWKLPDEVGSDGQPVTSAQLALLRRRLAGDLRGFEQAMGEGGKRDRKQREALVAVMAGLCRTWEYAPDAVLRQYVAQTDRGLRLHSWSAVNPAFPKDPDGGLHAEHPSAHENGARAPDTGSVKRKDGSVEAKAMSLTQARESRGFRVKTGPAKASRLHSGADPQTQPGGSEIGAGTAVATSRNVAGLLGPRGVRRALVALLLFGVGGGGAYLAKRGYFHGGAQGRSGGGRGYVGMNGARSGEGGGDSHVDQRPLPESLEEPGGVGGGMGGRGRAESSMASRGGSAVAIGASPSSGPAGSGSGGQTKPTNLKTDSRSAGQPQLGKSAPQKPKAAVKWDFAVRLDASPFQLDWTISPAAVPATFLALRSARGLSVEIPAELRGGHWVLPDGVEPACAIAAPHHAQLASRPESPLVPGTYELRAADDIPFIQIKIGLDGAVTAAVARGAHLYYWFSVQLSPADPSPTPPALRFTWERPWAAPLPATWHTWIAPSEARVEVPVVPLRINQQIESFSLHDASTSWSLTAKVRERPAS